MINYIFHFIYSAQGVDRNKSQHDILTKFDTKKILPKTKVQQFVSTYANLSSKYCLIGNTETEDQQKAYYNAVVNLNILNNLSDINQFFKDNNEKLKVGGHFIGTAITKNIKKQEVFRTHNKIIAYIIYTYLFIVWRLLPKLPVFRKIYPYFTKGKRKHISRAEILGRLIASGFDIVEEKEIDGKFYFVAKKVKQTGVVSSPAGLLIHLKRVGKGGRVFNVYKFRSMHPYSEYLQKYIYEQNGLLEGGKIDNDFRISSFGRLIRKYWIDELPMFFNLIKGDMKLVGVRPLSRHYFNLYPKSFKEQRIKFKPGLIPPFYVDMPKTLEEIIQSEKKYLEAYQKKPFITDCKYFFSAWYNILINGNRSK